MGRRIASIGILAAAAALVGPADVRPTATAARTVGAPAWRVVAQAGVPNLAGVHALSSTNVWAVGDRNGKPVIVHWDGRKIRTRAFSWKGRLAGVAAVSENDVWAVGSAASRPVALHFNGRRWQRMNLPLVKGGWLADVAAVESNDIWAVGGSFVNENAAPLVLHFDGRQWRGVNLRGAAPRPGELTSVDYASPRDVWAFGYTGPQGEEGYGFGPVVVRGDGSRWTRVRLPFGDGGDYKGYPNGALDVAPSGEVWTVQAENNGSCGDCTPQFVRWSGPAHAAMKIYSWGTYGHTVYDIAAVSKADVWSVGTEDYDLNPLIGRWNGKSWRRQRTPFDGYKDTSLRAISAISPTEIWSVGDGLIVRYTFD